MEHPDPPDAAATLQLSYVPRVGGGATVCQWDRLPRSLRWIWLFAILWADAPSDLAAGKSSAPKSPAVAQIPRLRLVRTGRQSSGGGAIRFQRHQAGNYYRSVSQGPVSDTPSPDLGGLKKGPVRVFCNPGEDVLDLLRSGDEEVAGSSQMWFLSPGYIDKKLGKNKLCRQPMKDCKWAVVSYACRYCDFDFIRDPADGVPKLFKSPC